MPGGTLLVRLARDNAGDHLITIRAMHHLQAFGVSPTLISPETLFSNSQQIQSSSNVIFGGGPFLAADFIDSKNSRLSGEEMAILARKSLIYGAGMGSSLSRLGWPDYTSSQTEKAHKFFSEKSAQFLRLMAENGRPISLRDSATTNVVERTIGVSSGVFETGCPVLFQDLRCKTDKEWSSNEGVRKRLLFTAPAKPTWQALSILGGVSRAMPEFEITVLYQSGFKRKSFVGLGFPDPLLGKPWLVGLNNFHERLADLAQRHNALNGHSSARDIVDSKGDARAMMREIEQASMVLGYRVHSHLYALSISQKSLLIAEDMRGFGQNEDLKIIPSLNLTSKTSKTVVLGSFGELASQTHLSDELWGSLEAKRRRHMKFLSRILNTLH